MGNRAGQDSFLTMEQWRGYKPPGKTGGFFLSSTPLSTYSNKT